VVTDGYAYTVTDELGIAPHHKDWENVLKDTLSRFKKYRTWA
jgi:hypothetical protein